MIEDLNLKGTKEETLTIAKIAKRAHEALGKMGIRRDFLDIVLDITVTHLNGNPLALDEFLNGGEPDFMHDVTGIMGHLNRETGELEDCFSPRFSKCYWK